MYIKVTQSGHFAASVVRPEFMEMLSVLNVVELGEKKKPQKNGAMQAHTHTHRITIKTSLHFSL